LRPTKLVEGYLVAWRVIYPVDPFGPAHGLARRAFRKSRLDNRRRLCCLLSVPYCRAFPTSKHLKNKPVEFRDYLIG